MPTKNTVALSIPQRKTVRGYEIERQALGRYLEASQALQSLPDDLLKTCFPGQSLSAIWAQLKTMNGGMLQAMIGNALLTAPKHVFAVVSILTGIGEDALREDANIGLDGLLEILAAWVEVNNLGDFPNAVRKLIGKARTADKGSRKQASGFNGLLRSLFPSA